MEVKPAAFIPRKGPGGRLEPSVVGIDGLSPSQIWQIGKQYVIPAGRSLKGRADILASAILSIGLDLIDDSAMESRHSHIVNWPDEKASQLEKSVELAMKSTLELFKEL